MMPKKAELVFALLFVLVAMSQATECRAQTWDPYYFFPLVSNSKWTMNDGAVMSVVGSRTVKGRQGTVCRWSDGTEYVYAYQNSQLLMLQIVILDPDYGKATITFSAPLVLMAKGDNPGASHSSDTGITLSVAGDNYSGTVEAQCRFLKLDAQWTVPAGTFENVAEISFVAALETDVATLDIDWKLWIAEGSGIVQIKDFEEGTEQKLSGGTIGGQAISPLRIRTKAPNGREFWKKGTTQTIRWESNRFFIGENVRIYLFENDQFLREIIGSTTNDGEYAWKVAADVSNGLKYKVAVMADREKTIRDYSDGAFLIAERSGVIGASWLLYP